MKRHFCVICVAASAYSLWQVARFTWPFLVFAIGEKLKGDHNTLLCRAGEACSLSPLNFTLSEEELTRHAVFSPDLAAEEVDRIHSVWQQRFEARRRQQGGPLFLHVGPADLGDEDLNMYKWISPFMQGGCIVFVEPHPGQQLRLKERIRAIGVGNSTSTSVLAAALCTDAGSSVHFYRISDKFFDKFTDIAFYIRYWASLNKQHLIDETQFFNYNQKVWLFKAMKIFPESFPETVDDWLPYIDEAPVRCLTPKSLLEEVGTTPEAIDVLILDAEGYDMELLELFLAMDGFAPATVMFEWHLHGNDASKIDALVRLVRVLHKRGYDVHRHNHDVIAVAVGSAGQAVPQGA